MSEQRAPTLDDVIGQSQAVSTLRSAIASGRLHHAWIFSGPAGVGKRTTAIAFAAAILDGSTGPDLAGVIAPDPDSQIQRLIGAGTHPDLHVVTKELARFSEDRNVRERKLLSIPRDVIDTHLLAPIARGPSVRSEGSLASKVFIVDEAELLDRSKSNAPVQNAILKTLEEPPPGSVIILVTSAEDSLLTTIRSRCQRIAFQSLSEADMTQWFKRSGLDLSPAERDWLVWFAAGSPGRALEAARTGLFAWMESLEQPLAQTEAGRFSPALGATMAGLIDQWAKTWVDEHENASKEAANIVATRHMLGIIAERARGRLRAGADGDPQAVERSLRTLDVVMDAERYIAANVPIAHTMEDLAARLSRA